MEVNGLPLPAGLVRVLHDTGGAWTPWAQKEPVNAYGDELYASVETSSLEDMIEETASLPERFEPYDELEPDDEIEIPDFIPDVKDFSKIVVFGSTGSGEPFCLDYRDSLQEPKVIFRRDAYWRRVAPNFAAFWELLEPCP
jgi:SMI1/KNR4 family protein SUKH-1